MLPLIFVYRDKDNIEPAIEKFSQENSIRSEDVFRIIPEKRLLHIDQIKELIKKVSISSVRNRLFVIYDLDLAGPPAQNSLLKTLEEKKETDFFIVLASQLELVLTTIRSRCNVIYIEQNKEFNVSTEMNEFLTLLIHGSIKTLSHSFVMSMNLEKAIPFLDELIVALQHQLENNPARISKILKEALQIKALLQSNNLNPQLAIDSFLLKYCRVS